MAFIEIDNQPIDVSKLQQKLIAPEYGGLDIFVGFVRQWTGKIETQKIEYTSYRPMAIKELTKIAAKIEKRGGRVVIKHRLGELKVGDLAVFVGVAAPHRQEAFEWCKYAIDTLKEEVPIWKKEYDTDKVRWGNS